MLTVFLFILIFSIFVSPQFLSYDAVRMRVSGQCMLGDYDCGLGQCISISQFRDGKPDCMDGSDEWCFIGQVSCGPVYCADYKDALPCIVYPKCDGTSKQLPWCSASKEKLCADKTSFPCKGYGECVLWEWLLDGKKDCIDGSDEDENYVLILENSYRAARNKNGIVLTKPISSTSKEDQQSLFVQGCSFCPHNSGSGNQFITSKPPNESVDMATTPKDPFNAIPSANVQKTIAPLSNFPIFTTPDTKLGEFFPVNVKVSTIDRETTNSAIGDFFPTHTPSPQLITYPTPSRVIVVPSGKFGSSELPKLPNRPTETSEHSPSNNWPIPILTTTTDFYQKPLEPITYPSINKPSVKIPVIQPQEHVFIKTTTSSYSGESWRLQTTPYEIGSSGYGNENQPTIGIDRNNNVENGYDGLFGFPDIQQTPSPTSENEHNHESLIPLNPGNFLPTLITRKPWVITKSLNYLTSTKSPIDNWKEQNKNNVHIFEEFGAIPTRSTVDLSPITYPALIPSFPNIETSKQSFGQSTIEPFSNQFSSTTISSKLSTSNNQEESQSSTTKNHEKEGWIEEIDEKEAEESQTTSAFLSSTTHPKPTNPTGAGSKVIHVGPNGVVGSGTSPSKHKSSEDDDEMATSTENDESTDTTTYETTKRTTKIGGSHESDGRSCLSKMIDTTGNGAICECENGQFKNRMSGECEEALSLMNVKIHLKSVCDMENIDLKQKQLILHTKIQRSIGKDSCIQSQTVGDSMIATIKCEDCTVADTNLLLNTKLDNEPSEMTIISEAFGEELCEDSSFNHCHNYADCVVDNEGIRYACRCKEGTTDVSEGFGRICEGFPLESDCIKLFGICLIVWLLFLLGVFMLTILFCLASYTLCRKRCCRHILIHPANSEGLQTVVIGSRAKKMLGMEDDEQLPHMRAIFAESLKNSAKGSSTVASALAIADMKKKKVSKVPSMDQVVEEKDESPTLNRKESSIHEVSSLPKIGSLAKLSTHTINSEPAIPLAVIETPILEKKSSTVSLVSSNGNAPHLPNLPMPLPVPITTSASSTSLGEKKDENTGGTNGAQQPNDQERPGSAHSIGVQPTIWETYRVLGQQYSKSEKIERKPSVDSLEQMFEARLAETARTNRTIKTERSSTSPITFTASSHKDVPPMPSNGDQNPQISEQVQAQVVNNIEETKILDQPDQPTAEDTDNSIKKNLEETAENKEKQTDSKIAEMIGVTSFNSEKVENNVKENEEKEVLTDANTENSLDASLENSLEAALLAEMAKRGIELPLSPSNPIKTFNELKRTSSIDDDVAAKIDSRRSSAKSITSARKSRIPSSTSAARSRSGSIAKVVRKSSIGLIAENAESGESSKSDVPEIFVPAGVKKTNDRRNPKLRKIGTSETIGSTTESDPEVEFFKKLEDMNRKKKKEDDFRQIPYSNKKYVKRRRPERTLSSISEKSAEILADVDGSYPVDTSVSCPTTTRLFLQPKSSNKSRYSFKRKIFEATGETSDVDIPKTLPIAVHEKVVSSPEIPDVTIQRSIENLHQTTAAQKYGDDGKDDDLNNIPLFSEHLSARSGGKSGRSSRKKNNVPSSSRSTRATKAVSSSGTNSKADSRGGSRSESPMNEEETISHTSRSTRHSLISRKIAIRKHELKAVRSGPGGSARDFSGPQISRTGLTNNSMRGYKSVGDLSRHRPPWDISNRLSNNHQTNDFLPSIRPTMSGCRTTMNSPQRHYRSDSHYSLTSFTAHSPTSFWSSPYFNPSEDSRKPPKEDLWWNPNK